MHFFATMDALFRDRNSIYEQARQSENIRRLFWRLMLVFMLTSALYGVGMGSFRLFHPQFFFSDFEISGKNKIVIRGKIAGMNPDTRTVFAERTASPLPNDGQIRFNVSYPSETVPVVAISDVKEFSAIVLPKDMPLEESDSWKIPALVAIKTPFLFLLTLLICAPALYVLNLVFDIRLHFMPVMTLMACALAATGTLLAVFVPISGLFSVVTESYHFMKVFHVIVFAIAGAFGVKVLAEGLMKVAPEGAGSRRKLLLSWLMLYCIVGGQVAWTMKPFLGTPYLPATPPFRVEAGNIYVSAFSSLTQMGK